VEVVSFGLEDHSRAVSGADIILSPSIKHTTRNYRNLNSPGPVYATANSYQAMVSNA
jgi:hypothetical protein